MSSRTQIMAEYDSNDDCTQFVFGSSKGVKKEWWWPSGGMLGYWGGRYDKLSSMNNRNEAIRVLPWFNLWQSYVKDGKLIGYFDYFEILHSDTEQFLKARGYNLESVPKDGDVVAFRCKPHRRTQHFGIYCSGEVVSKLADEPPIIVPLEVEANKWEAGDILFFREALELKEADKKKYGNLNGNAQQ